ncbi:MAG: hypothetical protein ACRDBO_12875 [Lachnospiraceae bacterium]
MFNYNPLYPQENGMLPDTGMIEVIPNDNNSDVMIPPPNWENNPPGNFPPQFWPQMPSNPISNVFRLCMNNLMYITLRNGENFWYYPIDSSQNIVNGYRWDQQTGWFNYTIQFSSIQNAYCYNQ